MYITPLLEKIIALGKARYVTFNVGGGGYFKMPFSSTETVVITGVVYYPCNDAKRPIDQIGDPFKRILHTMHFRSKNKTDYLTMRGAFLLDQQAQGLKAMYYVQQPCYFIHKGDVDVFFTHFEGFKQWAISQSVNDKNTQAEERPKGYGTVAGGFAQTVTLITFDGVGGVASYIPQTPEFQPSVPPASENRQQFVANVTPTTAIEVGTTNDNAEAYTHPVATIHCVVMEGELKNYLNL